uniref:Signal peptidase complex subunit 2 n=1 Tax=Glossina morsitans morsitans TaxID=37546 RepID=A0A1B0G7B1_GLOMM
MSKKDDKSEQIDEFVKINKWDGAAVKLALNDAVKHTLFATRPHLKEHFGLINTRLILSTSMIGVALMAYGWDVTHPFPESKPVFMFCAVAYFSLMGVLTLHTTFREKGTIVVATEEMPNGERRFWEASSDMKKYDDKYTLVLSVKDTKSLKKTSSVKSCASFIDVNGVVLYNLVANEVDRLYNSLSIEKKEK